MDITKKCPNCFQQVSTDTRFCIYCGFDFEGVKTKPDNLYIHTDSSQIDPVPYDGPCFCPVGHDVHDPSLGFCPTCGSLLVNEPSTGVLYVEEPEVHTEPPPSRVCHKCGYVCNDPDLSFCLSCGLSFDESATAHDPGWICACGAKNTADKDNCVSCAKPKGWRPDEPDPKKKSDDTFHPPGMKPPTDDDLKIKSTYGN